MPFATRFLAVIVISANVAAQEDKSTSLANAPAGEISIMLNGQELTPEQFTWDGGTLWVNTTLNKPALLLVHWN